MLNPLILVKYHFAANQVTMAIYDGLHPNHSLTACSWLNPCPIRKHSGTPNRFQKDNAGLLDPLPFCQSTLWPSVLDCFLPDLPVTVPPSTSPRMVRDGCWFLVVFCYYEIQLKRKIIIRRISSIPLGETCFVLSI